MEQRPPVLHLVRNRHVKNCGTAPAINPDDKDIIYVSYFENEYGEQAVFILRRGRTRGNLWMGDCHWNKPYEIEHNPGDTLITAYREGDLCPIVLGKGETLWLSACLVATEYQRQHPQPATP